MLHILVHLAVPLLVAYAFYRPRWAQSGLVMIAMMVVDLDHLLARPIYDPARCSIGFHPLHTTPAIVVYALVFAVTLVGAKKLVASGGSSAAWWVHVSALGLLVHMALDWGDCLL